MDAEQIKGILDAELLQCDVKVEGGDVKYGVTIVGDLFEDLNAVKRQQKVYQILNDHISSGAIHAITMRLFTKAEFDSAS